MTEVQLATLCAVGIQRTYCGCYLRNQDNLEYYLHIIIYTRTVSKLTHFVKVRRVATASRVKREYEYEYGATTEMKIRFPGFTRFSPSFFFFSFSPLNTSRERVCAPARVDDRPTDAPLRSHCHCQRPRLSRLP